MQNPPDSRAMLERAVDAARHDLARRQAVDSERIEVVEAKPVTWPNGAMGCPEPGGMYTQALVPGVKIILRSGERRFHYHGRRDGEPFLCPEDRVQSPAPGEKPET